MHNLNLYVSGAIILALVAAAFGTYIFFANRRAKHNMANARQRSADSRASLAATPTTLMPHSNSGGGNSTSAAERAKKKKARKLASKQRRQNRR